MTKTIATHAFQTPEELWTGISTLLNTARCLGIEKKLVRLDCESDLLRLVEVTLTDGSKVYNIEFD